MTTATATVTATDTPAARAWRLILDGDLPWTHDPPAETGRYRLRFRHGDEGEYDVRRHKNGTLWLWNAGTGACAGVVDSIAGESYSCRRVLPMPVPLARDWLMEEANCERGDAVRWLAVAAAMWLEAERPNDQDGNHATKCIVKLDLDSASDFLKWFDFYKDDGTLASDTYAAAWLAWRAKAERAVALLREAAAPDPPFSPNGSS